jgi:uncharacterized protein YciI
VISNDRPRKAIHAMHYLLIYDVVDSYVERRAPYRAEHLLLANQHAQRGELILGGALEDPVDQAILVFQVEDPAIIEHFVSKDPYVQNGLIRSWRIRRWNVAAGCCLKSNDPKNAQPDAPPSKAPS